MKRLKKHRRNNEGREAGFTIVELIIVIVLTSLLGVFGFQMLAQSLIAQRNMQVRKEHSDDAVLALDKISRDLRQARSPIHVSTTGTPNQLGFVKAVSGGDRFVLYIRDTVTWQFLRYEVASNGDDAVNRAADYLTAAASTGHLIAESVIAFTASLSGDISLQFDGEDDTRRTSVHVLN